MPPCRQRRLLRLHHRVTAESVSVTRIHRRSFGQGFQRHLFSASGSFRDGSRNPVSRAASPSPYANVLPLAFRSLLGQLPGVAVPLRTLHIVGLPPNPALNLAPFGRWTLRDKAAQRRLALRWAAQPPQLDHSTFGVKGD